MPDQSIDIDVPSPLKFSAGELRLQEKFAPIIGHWTLLVRLGEVPEEVKTRLRPLFSQIVDLIQDDELGLIGCTPERRAQKAAEGGSND